MYLHAIALQTASERDAADRALRLLDQAIAHDPDFARAYELKAGYYWYQSGWAMDAPTAQALAYAAAMKALEPDPTLAGARSYANTANPDWNWIGEFEALEKLVHLEPTNIRALDSLTYVMILAGYFREASDVAERMIEVEPLSYLGYTRKSEALFAAGRDEEAREFKKFDSDGAKWQLGIDALRNGDDEAAVAWLEMLWIAVGQDPAEIRPLVTGARDPESGKAYVDEWIRSAVANAANLDERRSALFWYLPFGYLDEFRRAIDTLSRGIDKGWTNADLLEYSGMVLRRSGFARHPEYMPRARAQGTQNAVAAPTGEWRMVAERGCAFQYDAELKGCVDNQLRLGPRRGLFVLAAASSELL